MHAAGKAGLREHLRTIAELSLEELLFLSGEAAFMHDASEKAGMLAEIAENEVREIHSYLMLMREAAGEYLNEILGKYHELCRMQHGLEIGKRLIELQENADIMEKDAGSKKTNKKLPIVKSLLRSLPFAADPAAGSIGRRIDSIEKKKQAIRLELSDGSFCFDEAFEMADNTVQLIMDYGMWLREHLEVSGMEKQTLEENKKRLAEINQRFGIKEMQDPGGFGVVDISPGNGRYNLQRKGTGKGGVSLYASIAGQRPSDTPANNAYENWADNYRKFGFFMETDGRGLLNFCKAVIVRTFQGDKYFPEIANIFSEGMADLEYKLDDMHRKKEKLDESVGNLNNYWKGVARSLNEQSKKSRDAEETLEERTKDLQCISDMTDPNLLNGDPESIDLYIEAISVRDAIEDDIDRAEIDIIVGKWSKDYLSNELESIMNAKKGLVKGTNFVVRMSDELISKFIDRVGAFVPLYEDVVLCHESAMKALKTEDRWEKKFLTYEVIAEEIVDVFCNTKAGELYMRRSAAEIGKDTHSYLRNEVMKTISSMSSAKQQ